MSETRQVVIEWHDTPGELLQTHVVVDGEWNELDGEDLDIFFYFSKESEFQQAKTGEGYEFRIVEVLA